MSKKKKTYKVVIAETQNYVVKVEATSAEEAQELAEECYGCKGDIFSTTLEVILAEEVN
jgi:hypothetical protein